MNNQVIRIEDYFPEPELTGPSEFNDLPLSEQHDTVERMIATLTAMKGAIELLGTELNQCEDVPNSARMATRCHLKSWRRPKTCTSKCMASRPSTRSNGKGKAPTELVWFK